MKTAYDYLIIGAGPAGLQLAYFLEKRGRDYLILERGKVPGTFFKVFPRHGTLISINKVYTGKSNPEVNMRWDWNALISDSEEFRFKNYSQDYFPPPEALVQYLADYAEHYQLNIRYGTNVKQVSKAENGDFVVVDRKDNQFTGKRLIVATGLFKAMTPNFPGSELCDTYNTHSINPDDYRNQRVLVVGKGNSAFETADNLVGTTTAIHVLSPHSLKLAWETHFVGHLRAVNNNLLDTYQLKSQNTVIDATINCVEKINNKYYVDISYSHANGQTRRLEYDKVILCTGFRFDNSIFDEAVKPELVFDGKLPMQTSEWESANVPGMYFAGTIMQACDFKQTMSAFIHGFRHNVEALSNILEMKYEGQAWPSETIELSPEAVTAKIIDRANNSPAIFLQPGFMAEVIVIDEDNHTARLYKNVRKDYIPNSFLAEYNHYYVLSLEYGHFTGNPFNVERDPDPEMAHEAAYLHPIIRRFNHSELVTEHHIQDDLESEWHLDEYVKPALAFFESQLASYQTAEPA
ncbi:MAG: NAD(P)-binding domain-containing protein [Anaerolineales bacterium]|jgi:thioredoxin reductase